MNDEDWEGALVFRNRRGDIRACKGDLVRLRITQPGPLERGKGVRVEVTLIVDDTRAEDWFRQYAHEAKAVKEIMGSA